MHSLQLRAQADCSPHPHFVQARLQGCQPVRGHCLQDLYQLVQLSLPHPAQQQQEVRRSSCIACWCCSVTLAGTQAQSCTAQLHLPDGKLCVVHHGLPGPQRVVHNDDRHALVQDGILKPRTPPAATAGGLCWLAACLSLAPVSATHPSPAGQAGRGRVVHMLALPAAALATPYPTWNDQAELGAGKQVRVVAGGLIPAPKLLIRQGEHTMRRL